MQNNSEFSDSLVLGIDTGGTYTDAVSMGICAARRLHKSLTTKRDFLIGIEKVIDGIHIDDLSAIKMVSVSTTLATNAIAEGKGKRVVPLLIGYDPELVADFKMERRFATRSSTISGRARSLRPEKAGAGPAGDPAQVSRLERPHRRACGFQLLSPLDPEHENRDL